MRWGWWEEWPGEDERATRGKRMVGLQRRCGKNIKGRENVCIVRASPPLESKSLGCQSPAAQAAERVSYYQIVIRLGNRQLRNRRVIRKKFKLPRPNF